jgi:uncharacterized protein (DUF111 family)
VTNVTPEFDDCVALATSAGVPVKEVQADACRAARGPNGPQDV